MKALMFSLNKYEKAYFYRWVMSIQSFIEGDGLF